MSATSAASTIGPYFFHNHPTVIAQPSSHLRADLLLPRLERQEEIISSAIRETRAVQAADQPLAAFTGQSPPDETSRLATPRSDLEQTPPSRERGRASVACSGAGRR